MMKETKPGAWVLGDCILDINRYVRYSRPSPENANCPVGIDEHSEVVLGGAGNVARWLAGFGLGLYGRVTLIGLWGRGETDYSLLAESAHTAGVTLGWYLERRRAAISTKERVYMEEAGSWKQIARIDSDTDAVLEDTEGAQLVAGLEGALNYAVMPPILVIADYGKGVFTGDEGAALIRQLSKFVEEKKLVTVVNSKFPERWANFPADVLVCNRQEFEGAWPGDEPVAIAARYLLVTRGEQGVRAYQQAGTGCGGMRVMVSCLNVPSLLQPAQVRDVTGAGDAFLAGAAMWLTQAGYQRGAGLSIEQLYKLVMLGQVAALGCCQQLGCGSPEELGE